MKLSRHLALVVLLFATTHCTKSDEADDGDSDSDAGDGDGDLPGDGDGDLPGDGDGDFAGDGDGDLPGDGDGDLPGDGDGDLAGDGDGDLGDGDGDGPEPGCVVDLNCDPAVLPSTGDFSQDCVNRINQFRVGCHCLPPLERWTEGEACATANAEFDQDTGQPHSGWRSENGACPDDSGPLSSQYYGWATNECPGYGSAESVLSSCLKSMYGEGAEWAEQLGRAPTQEDYGSCEDSCYSANGHFIAMTKASHTKVACGITTDGEIWSVQNFTDE